MNKKPKYFSFGRLISKFLSKKIVPKKNDKLFDILNNYKKITFNSLISIPGYAIGLIKMILKHMDSILK